MAHANCVIQKDQYGLTTPQALLTALRVVIRF